MSAVRLLLGAGTVALLAGCSNPGPAEPWRDRLRAQIQRLGDRNWIVIAEASFPAHSRKGVVQSTSTADIPGTLDAVLTCIDSTEHVRPRIFTARELRYIDNDEAPGIDAFRDALEASLNGRPRTEIDHQSLVTLLEDAGQTFDVLVIRTPTTLPYASVFLELQHGYWNPAAERALRLRMAAEPPPTARP